MKGTIGRALCKAALVFSLLCSVQTVNGQSRDLQLRYLGAAGWEIKADDLVILVDPYVSRIKYGGRNHDVDDGRRSFEFSDVPVLDTELIRRTVPKADFILVHHSHPDHLLDVPYIAKMTGAKVIGTETTANILRAYGIPDENLHAVQGGEDYQFAGPSTNLPTNPSTNLSIRIIRSLHSTSGHNYLDSRQFAAGRKAPLKIEEFVEGGTLMFLVRIAGHEVLTMGSMNFIEAELRGVAPTVLLAGAGSSRKEIYKYTQRLMAVTGFPGVVIPTHWDNFFAAYGNEAPQAIARKNNLEPFVREVAAASPSSRIIVPEHLKEIRITAD